MVLISVEPRSYGSCNTFWFLVFSGLSLYMRGLCHLQPDLNRRCQVSSANESMPIKLQAGKWEVDEAVNKTEQCTEFHQMGSYHHQICHGIRYSNALKAPEEKYTKHYRNFISRSSEKMMKHITFQRQLNLHSRDSGQGGWVTSNRISLASLCLHHQSTSSLFASLQPLILYHH